MYRGIIALAAVLAVTGCQTARDSLSSHDKNRGQVVIQTADDSRSALPDPAKDEGIQAVEANLSAKTRANQTAERLVALAKIQLVQKKLDEARVSAMQVLRLDQKNVEARIVLAQISLRKNNIDMASIILNGLGSAVDKDSSVMNMRAMIAYKKDDMDSAMGYWKESIKLNPMNIAPRMNLGVLHVKYKQLSRAVTQFERVLKVMPGHRDAILHLAAIKGVRGDKNGAIEMLEGVLETDNQNPLALYNLAVLQNSDEDYDDALVNLKTYLKSQRVKATDGDRVFALIDSIQKSKSAGGDPTDSEIQAMAANMGSYSDEPAAGKSVASAEKPKKVKEKKVEKTRPRKAAVKAAKKKSVLDGLDDQVGEDADIDDLERALEE